MIFLDPLIQAPLLGSLMMSLSASLLGVFLFLRKRSLVGEVLSHAAFPGLIVGLLLGCTLSHDSSDSFFPYLFALISCLIGYFAIEKMSRLRFSTSDGALSFVLASFFGAGILLMSILQSIKPSLCRKGSSLFFGQLALMRDTHLIFYSIVSCIIILSVIFFYKEFKSLSFDHSFSKLAIPFPKLLDNLLFFLVSLVTILGIRTVGIILISAALLVPAIAARQYSERLAPILFLSAGFGLLSTFLGCIISYKSALSLPPGPLIVTIGVLFALLSLLFAPKRGYFFRLFRTLQFKLACLEENILKDLWKRKGSNNFIELNLSSLSLRLTLFRFLKKGWIEKKNKSYFLTLKGEKRGAQIVRLHRLWESYLVTCVGRTPDKVHKSAEEMEHILDSEIEEEIAALLSYPTSDPHKQPIPPREAL